MNILENRVPPPLLLVGVALLMWAAARMGVTASASVLLRLVGSVVMLGGIAIVISGFLAFRRAGTTIDPVNIDRAEKLVTSGIFGLTRNPMYLGFTLMLLGWSLFLGSLWLLIGPLLFALFIHRFQIKPEERVIDAKFGEGFKAYRRRVRRWL